MLSILEGWKCPLRTCVPERDMFLKYLIWFAGLEKIFGRAPLPRCVYRLASFEG